MNTNDALRAAGGRSLDTQEIRDARLAVTIPQDLERFLTSTPVVGVSFTMDADHDESRIGVEMRWMDVAEMRSEATDVYPGIWTCADGYTPIGICLSGSGDAYFYRHADGAIVRIPHDLATQPDSKTWSVEIVAPTISGFLAKARIGD